MNFVALETRDFRNEKHARVSVLLDGLLVRLELGDLSSMIGGPRSVGGYALTHSSSVVPSGDKSGPSCKETEDSRRGVTIGGISACSQ